MHGRQRSSGPDRQAGRRGAAPVRARESRPARSRATTRGCRRSRSRSTAAGTCCGSAGQSGSSGSTPTTRRPAARTRWSTTSSRPRAKPGYPIPRPRPVVGRLAGEGQRARRRQVDRRLDRRVRLHVVPEDGRRVEPGVAVGAVAGAEPHVVDDPGCGRAVRPLDDRSGQDRRRAVERPDQVCDLVLHAVRVGGAVADGERDSPGVCPEHVCEPPCTGYGVAVGVADLVVLARHDGQAEPVRAGVVGGPREPESERVGRPCASARSSCLRRSASSAAGVTCSPAGSCSARMAR